MNNTFIFILSSFPAFFYNIFYYCFYHLPLETQQISNISPHENNIMIFSKIRMLNMLLRIFLFIHTFFFPVISSNIHCYFNNIFHAFKVLKKFITTEMFNINFYNKFIKFWIISFFQLFFIYIYIYNAMNGTNHILNLLKRLLQILSNKRATFSRRV